MGTKISALSAVTTPLGGTETLAAVQTTTKKVTAAELAAYAMDVIVAASAATPTTGDYILAARSTDEKRLTLDNVAVYVGDYLATNVSAVTPLATDHVMLNDAGVLEKVLVSALNTKMLDGSTDASATLKASIRDISGLSSATLDATDNVLIDEGGTAKKETLANLATYMHQGTADGFDKYLTALSAASAMGATDLFYVTQSGTPGKLTGTQIQTYIVAQAATIVATIFDAASGDPVVDADVFALDRSNVPKTVTATQLGAYTTALLDAAALDPVLNATKFTCFAGSTVKTATAAVLAVYIGDYLASGVSAVTPLATDHVMLNDAGVLEKVLVSTFNTKMLDGSTDASATLKASIRNISGVGAATPSGDEYMLLVDGTTPKQKTLDQVAAFVHNDGTVGIAAYVGDQADADPIVDTDLFLVDRSDATKYISATDLATYVRDEIFEDAAAWGVIADGNYTDTPASTSRLTMSDTTGMEVGLPLRYTIAGTKYYGIVDAVSANSYIDVRGAPLSGDVTELCTGAPGRAVTKRVKIPGAYLVPWAHNLPNNDANADGLTDAEATSSVMLADIAREYFDWRGAPAFLVSVAVTQRTADGGANEPYFNILVAGSLVLGENTNKGIQVSATPGTWTESSAIEISSSNYRIVEDEPVEVKCTAPTGCKGDGCDVSLELVFVYE